MRNASLLSLSITGILALSGCSGHVLQDLADSTFNNKKPEAAEPAAVTEAPTSTQTEQDIPAMPERPQQETPVVTEHTDEMVAPSQNSELNRVSPMPVATSEGGVMQKNIDKWTEEEWTPTVEKNATIKAMNEDKDRPFTLQEYVDKASVYLENKPKSGKPSHAEELEKLPVIGK